MTGRTLVYGNEELTQELEQYLRDLVTKIGHIEAKVDQVLHVWIAISVGCAIILLFAVWSSRRKLTIDPRSGAVYTTDPIIGNLFNWALLGSILVFFGIVQDFFISMMHTHSIISQDIETYLDKTPEKANYVYYKEFVASLLINAAIMSFTAGLLASHWILFLGRRLMHPKSIKALDYVYFALGLLALYVNFSNLLGEEVLFRRAVSIDLAMTVVALRIAKTTAEICQWHR
jgi:hypothetical protein